MEIINNTHGITEQDLKDANWFCISGVSNYEIWKAVIEKEDGLYDAIAHPTGRVCVTRCYN